MTRLSRRQFLGVGLGAITTVAASSTLAREAWPLLAREDLVPGRAPEAVLPARAWATDPDRLSFVAVGDTGSGGRQAMAVAGRMAAIYAAAPYGLVSLLGDISYYGAIQDRFDDVVTRPLRPLIDAGVTFELAVGDHDGRVHEGDPALAGVDEQLTRLGTPARSFTSSHGPVDFFYLDAIALCAAGPSWSGLGWLDEALAASDNRWKVVCLHRPLHSSGFHGPTPGLAEILGPILARHHVDLVLTGHDHHYERSVPIDGTTHVVSGGGCKVTRVRPSATTAVAESTLHVVHLEVDGDRLEARAIRPDGSIVDRFQLRAREGR